MNRSKRIIGYCASAVGLALLAGCQEPAPPMAEAAAPPPACSEYMVNFNTASVLMQPKDRETINAATLKAQDPAARFLLIGKTDTVGSNAANLHLSQRRSDAVYRALIDNGVLATHIDRTYTGKMEPVVATGDQEAEPRNRTVVIRAGTGCHA
jgi:outer membrane protein OmpA-like peptidoglycan-associated protein